MPIYDYTAIDDYGKKIEGQCAARGEKDLEKILSQMGLYLLEAKVAEEIHSHVHYESPRADIRESGFFAFSKERFNFWTLLWLIFFFPVGLFFLWRRKKHVPLWSKIIVTMGFGLWSLIYFFGPKESKVPVIPSYIQANIPYEVLRDSHNPGHSRILEIVVPPTTDQSDALRLAKIVLKAHEGYSFILLQIFDDTEACISRRDINSSYPEKEYWKHFLVDALDNKKTSSHWVNWVAEGR